MTTPDKNLDYEENTSVSDVHASVKREQEDPQTGLEPATIGVFATCAVFLLIGGAYLGANGGFNKSSLLPGYTPETPKGTEIEEVAMTPEKWIKDGKGAFNTVCASCHGGNGMGISADHPPLAGSEWVLGGTERLTSVALYGLTGAITVKGKGYSGAQEMPAHKDTVSDNEKLAKILSYVRNSWGNEASLIYPDMIAAARKKNADRVDKFTASELPDPTADLPGTLPEWAGGAAPEGEGAETPPADDADATAPPAE